MIHNTFDMTTDEKFDYLTDTMMGSFDRVYDKFGQIDDQFRKVDKRFDEFENKMNLKFVELEDKMDKKFEKVDKRFDRLENDMELVKKQLGLITTHLGIKDATI